MNELAVIGITTPKYQEITNLWKQSLLNIVPETCIYLKELPDPTDIKEFFFYRHEYTVEALQNVYEQKVHRFVAFSDCDVIFKSDSRVWWQFFLNWFTRDVSSVSFLREGKAEMINAGFFIMKVEYIPEMIDFLKFVLSHRGQRFPQDDQTVINQNLQKIQYSFIPSEYVVWGPAKNITNQHSFLLHHAVCTTSLEEKILQIRSIQKLQLPVVFSDYGSLKIYFCGNDKKFGSSLTLNDKTLYSPILERRNNRELLTIALQELIHFQIVVARYNENVSWLVPFASKTLVYNKSDAVDNSVLELIREGASLLRLPNVGHEAHTYLHYIVEHYDKLPDWVIFTQGSHSPHILYQDFVNKVVIPNGTGISTNYTTDIAQNFSTVWDFTIDTYSKTKLASYGTTFGPFWDTHIKKSKENIQRVYWGAIFSVSKERILLNSKDYYKELLETVSKNTHPETAHFLERSWYYMFHE